MGATDRLLRLDEGWDGLDSVLCNATATLDITETTRRALFLQASAGAGRVWGFHSLTYAPPIFGAGFTGVLTKSLSPGARWHQDNLLLTRKRAIEIFRRSIQPCAT